MGTSAAPLSLACSSNDSAAGYKTDACDIDRLSRLRAIEPRPSAFREQSISALPQASQETSAAEGSAGAGVGGAEVRRRRDDPARPAVQERAVHLRRPAGWGAAPAWPARAA